MMMVMMVMHVDALMLAGTIAAMMLVVIPLAIFFIMATVIPIGPCSGRYEKNGEKNEDRSLQQHPVEFYHGLPPLV